MAQSGMDVEGAERVDAEDEVAWARTALKGLGSVEVTMRCPICQGFFRSPCSLKGCGHAFCSECIRRAVQVKSECPTCRKKSSAVDLIPNKAADAMVRAFLRERPEFAAVARGLPVSGESDAVATSAHGQVSTGRAGKSADSKRSKEVEKKRLPNVNFHLLKDKRVREMASGYKLSSTGPRIKVVRRIKEYILLVNTLVDGDAPMTEADLERVRQNVIAKEALLDRDTGPSLLGGSGKKGSLPPVVLNDAMMQLFARLRQDVITREGIKRPGGKRGNKRKAKRLKREAKTDDTGAMA
ncbi:E3 ubiquitin-protein ligase RAD18 [Hondaea fermentalgiana]|uniref:RING-type E3 ubiquitin transferase n=1 Tax=Hondaea fermentalgiana TaxID=2315210 RepID=A0A2R5G8Z6_9STRA|nr:E3 ubiquitin-protein ligase RAD18 [Hondaea fermentalgiana]|eukprot:GBG27015.1 E3 ubiquitin-protein ligase RAD18 [Hondaea fermentalgiana]